MLDKYILELLRINNRIIIPKIGAFILKKQGEDEIISFNGILKFDDGLFTNHIMDKEHIDKNGANAKINEFANSILSVLEDGSQYKIENIGSIYKDANGKIQFLDINSFISKQSTSKPLSKKEINEKTIEKVLEIETESEQKIESKAEKAPIEKEVSSSDSVSSKEMKIKKDEIELTKENNHKKEFKPKETKKMTTTNQSNSKKIIVICIVILLIGIGVTAVLLFADRGGVKTSKEDGLFEETMSEDSLQKLEKELAEQSDSVSDLIAQEVTENTIQNNEITENSTVETPTTGTAYYIVAGCFSDESNADKLVKKLKKEGFSQAKKFGKLKDMHAVSFISYTTEQEARTALEKIKSEKEPNAWITKY